MNIIMYVSSVTGNTQKVADVLAEHLRSCCPQHNLLRGQDSLRGRFSGRNLPADSPREPDLRQPDPGQPDPGQHNSLREPTPERNLVILCFWCRKGSLDDLSRRTLAGLSGCRILAFGTMGFYPDSEYGRMVKQNVAELISEHNTCLGVFTCQGKIPEERTERRRALPHNHKHWLDDAGYARHLESRKHPDEQDLADALRFLEEQLDFPS